MRILRLKLTNFIGIKSGLGKDVVEINFPKNTNIFTMFIGGNGSGKTTILSQLTPFKSSYDDRKTLIIPGLEGEKQIDIEDNEGNIFKIRHIYSKTPASFITENDVELNENGSVRNFESIVKDKLGVDDNYFTVGKLGSNVKTFVELKDTERFNYIKNLIRPIDKYTNAYSVTMSKLKTNKEIILSLGDSLKAIGPISNIKASVKQYNDSIAEIDKNIDSCSRLSGTYDSDISKINNDLNKYNYLQLKTDCSKAEQHLKDLENTKKDFESKHATTSIAVCDDMISKANTNIEALNTSMALLNQKITTLMGNKLSNDNEIAKIKLNLSSKSTETSANSQAIIDSSLKEKKALQDQLSTSALYALVTDTNALLVQSYIDSFASFTQYLSNNYGLLQSHKIVKDKTVADVIFSIDADVILDSKKNEIAKYIAETTTEIDKLKSQYAQKSANLDKYEILKKRPIACTIDSCPFIKDALQYSNLENEMVELSNSIKVRNNLLETYNYAEDSLTDIMTFYATFKSYFSLLNSSSNIIFKVFTKDRTISEIIDHDAANDFLNSTITEIADANKMVASMNRIAKLDGIISQRKSQLSLLKESEDNHSYFEKQLSDLTNSENKFEKDIAEAKQELNIQTNSLGSENAIKKTYENYKEVLNNLDATNKTVTDLKASISLYESLAKNKTELSSKKEDSERTLKTLRSNRDSTNASVMTLLSSMAVAESDEAKLKNISSVYSMQKSISAALDPRTGIPRIFTKVYLTGISEMANALLDIAYNGKFSIAFKLENGKFIIQVKSGSNIIDDISDASQGEIALTTISISLAIIEKSLTQYNILYLDEIDGALDDSNRSNFINILNKQVSKYGIDQVFIISHNNAFDACPMNLIMLNGSDTKKADEIFMKNKNIIFDNSI